MIDDKTIEFLIDESMRPVFNVNAPAIADEKVEQVQAESSQVVETRSVIVRFAGGGARRLSVRAVDGVVDRVHWEGLPL